MADDELIYINQPKIGMINVIGDLGLPINLSDFYEKFVPDEIFVGIRYKENKKGFVPENKKNKKGLQTSFYNQITIITTFNLRLLKIKIFNSGKVHIPGVKAIEDCQKIINLLEGKAKNYIEGELISIIDYDKMMITMQYQLQFSIKIDKRDLANFIRTNYKTFSMYNPERNAGILVKWNNLTIMIQSSGIISVKGSNTMEKNMLAHDYMNKILLDYIQITKRIKAHEKDGVDEKFGEAEAN